mmetsp:Transcript_130521/g.244193  ORF Transcript_130521/g.244193 Transcript_130521/m.244193 type:complete len:119 (+) Transcript_130521:38-394(+)
MLSVSVEVKKSNIGKCAERTTFMVTGERTCVEDTEWLHNLTSRKNDLHICQGAVNRRSTLPFATAPMCSFSRMHTKQNQLLKTDVIQRLFKWHSNSCKVCTEGQDRDPSQRFSTMCLG